MTDNKKEMKLVFAPGCFDNFEGTQEELDELVAEIQRTFDSGEFLEKMQPVDVDEILDDFTEEELEEIMEEVVNESTTRKYLQ